MRSIIKVILRLLAVLGFITVINYTVNNAIYQLRVPPEFALGNALYWAGVYIFIGILFSAAVYFFLWRKSDAVVRFLAGNIDDAQLNINTNNADLYRVVMSLVGIYLLVTAVPNLVGLVVRHFYYAAEYLGNQTPSSLVGQEVEGWIVNGLKALIGIWLLVGNRAVFRGLRYLWKAGETGKTAE